MSATVTATLRINAETGKLVGEFRAAGDASKAFGKSTEESGERAAKGTRKARDAIFDLNRVIKETRNAAIGLFAFSGAARLVSEARSAVDTYKNLQARLELVTGTRQRYLVAEQQTLAIAQRTYASLASTVQLYSRVQKAVDDLGGSQQQALRITELVNKTFAISGTRAAEAAAGQQQLSQALASGVLRGDEFNSVMENAPRLADALSKSLGKTRGELRAMAEEGELTADRVLKALLEQGKAIDEEFTRVPVTIERAWLQLSNSVMTYLGEADRASGASLALAESIQFLARHVEEIGAIVLTLSTLLAANLAARGIMAAVVAFRTMATTIGLTLAPMAAFEVGSASAAVAAGGLTRALVVLRAGIAAVLGPIGLITAGVYLIGKAVASEVEQVRTYEAAVTGLAEASAKLAERQAELDAEGPPSFGGAELAADLNTARAAAVEFDKQVGAVQDRIAELREEARNGFGGADTTGAISEQEAKLRGLMVQYDDAISKSARLSVQQREMAAAEREAADALAASTAAREAASDAIDDYIKAGQKRLEQLQEDAARLRGGEAAVQALRVAQLDLTNATEEQRKAMAELAPALARAAAEVEGMRRAEKGSAEAKREAAKLTRQWAQAERELDRSREDAADRRMEEKDATQELKDMLAAMDEELERSIELAGLDDEARRQLENALKAEAFAREVLKVSQASTNPLTEAEIELIRQNTEARLNQADATAKVTAAAKQAADEYQGVWLDAINGVSDAFAGLVDGSIRTWKEFGQSLIDVGRRFLAQLVELFIRTQLTLNASSTFSGGGGGGWGSLISTGVNAMGGSSSGSGIGSISGMGSAGFGFGGPLNTSALNSYGVLATESGRSGVGMYGGQIGGYSTLGIGAGIAGAAYGYQNYGNGRGSSVAAGVTYGVAGYAAGAGLAAGAGAIAAGGTAAAAGSAALAAIPVVGWIALALVAINSLTGGGLFGTRYKPREITQSVGIGEAGGVAGVVMQEERQRSLFRGRQRRYTDLDVPPEMQSQADQLYATVREAVRRSSEALGIEMPELVTGAFRTVLDSKGNVKKAFGEIMGKQYEESFELFQQRLLAENIIATVSVSAAEASTLAERWRNSAEALLAGAQFLLVAQTDINNAVGLLGEDGTLGDVLAFVEELAVEGEDLTAAYQRIQGSAQVLTGALSIMGVELDRSREEFVRFATDIADAAGGLENASALWDNYLSRFYSPEELGQINLTAATRNRDDEFADIGLDTSTTPEQFRRLFEEQLPTLSAAAVVEWLEAAAAMGMVIDAEGHLTQVRNEAAQAAREVAASLEEWEFDEALLGMTEYQQEEAKLNRLWDARIARLRALGASEEDIARAEGLRAIALGRLADSLSELGGTTTLPGGGEWTGLTGGGPDQDYMVAMREALQGLRDWLDGQRFDATSTLTPQQRFQEAQIQYQAALAAARANATPETIRALQDAAQRALQEGQAYLGGGDAYLELSRTILAGLEPLADLANNSAAAMHDVLSNLSFALNRFTDYLNRQGAMGGPNGSAQSAQVMTVHGGEVTIPVVGPTGGFIPSSVTAAAANDGNSTRLLRAIESLDRRMEAIEKAITTGTTKIANQDRRSGYQVKRGAGGG